MHEKVKIIIDKIKKQFEGIDTILVFGSATTPDWTEKSDVDVFLIDDSLNYSRAEFVIDGIAIEVQEDNFANIAKDIEEERGNLLHRNTSTMIATSLIIATKSPEKINSMMNLAKEALASKSNFTAEDIKMWRSSISDYLSKAEKDIMRNDNIAFYVDTYYVLQNALEMSLATNETYMPQPKFLSKLLASKDPELLNIWKDFSGADEMREKLDILKPLKKR